MVCPDVSSIITETLPEKGFVDNVLVIAHVVRRSFYKLNNPGHCLYYTVNYIWYMNGTKMLFIETQISVG